MTDTATVEWAQGAARSLLEQENNGALETADYQECEFVFAAAKLILSDAALAERIGFLMGLPRQ